MAKPVTIKILGDVSDLQKKLGSADSALGKFSKGAGNVAKGMGLAFGGAAVAVGAIGASALKSLGRIEKINAQTANVIKSTGAAAGVTVDQVEALAGSIEDLTGVEAESIQEGSNLLLTFTGIKNGVGEGNDIFDQATKIMTDMSVAFGTDASSSAIQLGKALNDPIKGITALTRVGVSFTAEQKAQIKALQESGDVMGAQKVILAELTKEFGGSAEAFGNTTQGKIEKVKHAFGTVTEALMAQVLPAITKAAEWMVKFTRSIIPIAEKYGPKVAAVIGAIASWVGDLARRYGPPLLAFVKRLVGRFIELAQKYGPMVVAFFQKVRETVARFVSNFTSSTDKVGSGANKLIGFFKRIWEMVKSYWEMIVAIIRKEIEIALWVWRNFGDRIVGILKGAWEIVWGVLQNAVGILTGLFNFIKALVTGKWGEAWNALKGILASAWNLIKSVLSGAIKVLGNLLLGIGRAVLMAGRNALEKAGEFISSLGEKLWGGITGIVDSVGEAISRIPGFLLDILAGAGSAAASVGRAIIDGIGSGLSAVGGFIADIGSAMKEAFVGAVNWVVDRLNDAIPNSIGAWGFSVDLPDNPIPRLKLATGGPAGGMVRVGERGPEDVILPRGSWVKPAHKSGGGQTITVNVATTGASPWAIAREVAWAAKTSGR